jgi:hypothetical protein
MASQKKRTLEEWFKAKSLHTIEDWQLVQEATSIIINDRRRISERIKLPALDADDMKAICEESVSLLSPYDCYADLA